MTEITGIDPFKIVEAETPTDRGRYAGPTTEQLSALAVSLKDQGQLQPITVALIPDTDRYHCVIGASRCDAARLIITGFSHDGKTYKPDAKFALDAIVLDAMPSTLETITMQASENIKRADVSPVDKAHIMQTMRDAGSKGGKPMRTLMGYTNDGAMSRDSSLLRLPVSWQNKIHEYFVSHGAKGFPTSVGVEAALPANASVLTTEILDAWADRETLSMLEFKELLTALIAGEPVATDPDATGDETKADEFPTNENPTQRTSPNIKMKELIESLQSVHAATLEGQSNASKKRINQFVTLVAKFAQRQVTIDQFEEAIFDIK